MSIQKPIAQSRPVKRIRDGERMTTYTAIMRWSNGHEQYVHTDDIMHEYSTDAAALSAANAAIEEMYTTTDDPIMDELRKSTGWGCNRQPKVNVVHEFLTEHDWPVERVEMVASETMHIYKSCDFSPIYLVDLGKWLQPDEFSDEGDYYRLWWD